ncbi:MAG: class I tRNA ligase family protein [Nanoarchaeota archaeon]
MTQNKFDKELEIKKFWEDKNIYERLKEKNKNSKMFNHVDGPPYPTGEIHTGHLRNWSIKDSVLKFKMLQGYDVYAKDGYDVHGLPVENKVQKKLNLQTVDDLKKFGEENFVKECKKYVSEIINNMSEVRNRISLWMDRDFYQTSHPEYLSMAWKFFKKADEKGLLYKDYKTVAWCPNDETTLSDYEIKDTYKELEDPSIYVKFPLKKEYRTTNYEESLLIWTTTPWTLQSNMAIAMHKDYEYSKILVELNSKKEVLIIATNLIQKLIKILSKQNNIKLIEILETKKGKNYEGLKYDHIYLDETPSQKEFLLEGKYPKTHSVILADFVTLGEGEDILEKLEKKGYKHSNTNNEEINNNQNNEIKTDGTGLVHIAPGHGFDDYEVGKKNNLPIFCPVGKNGKFNEGKYKGIYFKDVDPIAIEYLKEKNYLIYHTLKKHRYPCCWRCKTPIVYRATDQWWIKRSQYTDDIIKTNKSVKWVPESARTIFDNLMSNAGDWAISRQRYWGIPLPIFEDEDGNYKTFGSKEELEKEIGYKLKDIHRDDLKNITIKNPQNNKKMKPVPFIADVWFDSGCASFASHYNEGLNFDEIINKYYPIKWITESEDQVRGWFSSLFNVGFVVTNKAPYNEVLYYRYVMDKNGQKMSKSLGNGITGNEAIEKWGADATRYYLLTKAAPEDQINFNPEDLTLVDGFFNTLENLIKYMNSYIKEYEIRHPTLNIKTLNIEDRWILYKLNTTIQTYVSKMENFRLNKAYKNLEEFIVKDLSKTYLKLIKERTHQRDENLIIIFNEVLKKTLIMLATAIPFKAEYLYQEISFINKKESIFFENIPQIDELLIKDVEQENIDKNFELSQDIIQAILNAREKAQIGIRWPLSQVDIISHISLKELKTFEKLIKQITNISKIKYDIEDTNINYIIKPNFKTLKEDFDDIKLAISTINKNKYYISQDLKLKKSQENYDGIKIDLNKHIIKEIEIQGDIVSSDFSLGSIILHTNQDKILLEEGYLREIIRKVQALRKDLGLEKNEKISISFENSDEYLIDITNNWQNYISKKVGAVDILQKHINQIYEYKIKDKNLKISIKKE